MKNVRKGKEAKEKRGFLICLIRCFSNCVAVCFFLLFEEVKSKSTLVAAGSSVSASCTLHFTQSA
jgi:hypothetical protein